jgi:hypothetical protein
LRAEAKTTTPTKPAQIIAERLADRSVVPRYRQAANHLCVNSKTLSIGLVFAAAILSVSRCGIPGGSGRVGFAGSYLSGRYVPPAPYDIDLSRIVPKRVSHLQVQLLPRVDAQLGVIEAIRALCREHLISLAVAESELPKPDG